MVTRYVVPHALVAAIVGVGLAVSCAAADDFCSYDSDCPRGVTAEQPGECRRHACVSNKCVQVPLEDGATNPGAQSLWCTRPICVEGVAKRVAAPSNLPPPDKCTSYRCDGTTLVSTDAPCGVDASSDGSEAGADSSMEDAAAEAGGG